MKIREVCDVLNDVPTMLAVVSIGRVERVAVCWARLKRGIGLMARIKRYIRKLELYYS